jgi:hypothetical protein
MRRQSISQEGIGAPRTRRSRRTDQPLPCTHGDTAVEGRITKAAIALAIALAPRAAGNSVG